MKFFRILCLLVAVAIIPVAHASGVDDSVKVAKKQKALEKLKAAEASSKVYIFGLGTRMGDSTVYVTDIIEVEGVALDKKTKFLPYRSAFSLQLRQYLEGVKGNVNETCCVFFSDKRNTLAKKYYKVKKRYIDDSDSRLVVVNSGEFVFTKPEVGDVEE